MKINWDDIPEALWPFVSHGCEFKVKAKNQWAGTAPFDDKEGKFYVNPDSGQWDNKTTGEKGNVITFLGKMVEHYEDQCDASRIAKLAKDRGLPVEAFKPWRIGWDGQRYLIPMVSEKGTVRDLRHWSFASRRVMTTKGRPNINLGNLEALAKAPAGVRVWLCEGEWDAIALQWYLRALGFKKDIVVWVPGSMVFRQEWLKFFVGKKVICCYDNDEAGDKGSAKAREAFHSVGLKPLYINWPRNWETGWDLRAYITHAIEKRIPLKASFKRLWKCVSSVHRADDGTGSGTAVAPAEEGYLSEEEAPTFEELIEAFSKYLNMDAEMTLALKLTVAVCYSQQIGKKEPLWFYLVAAAGGGKTAMLSAMAGSRRTIFRSTVTPNALVSGFKAPTDPSLLPKLSGKTFIIKDFTTTLTAPDFEFEKVMSIWRDAFDGDFSQSYGNDVVRDYKNLHFSMVAGVTPAVHSKPQAMMGERFLKICMRTGNAKMRLERLMATMRSVGLDSEMEKALQDVAAKFLARQLIEEDVPMPPTEFLERFAALAQLLSMLRAQVARDKYDRDTIGYRPEPEVGTRPFKQFVKLARALYFCLRKTEYDEEIYSLVERVALDSCTGFNIEVVQALLRGVDPLELSIKQLAEKLGISHSTIDRAVKDLEVLGVLERVVGEAPARRPGAGAGRPPTLWRVAPEPLHVWRTARIGGRHGSGASPGPGVGRVRVRVALASSNGSVKAISGRVLDGYPSERARVRVRAAS